MSSISVKQEPGAECDAGESARGLPGDRVLRSCKEEPGISTEWMEHVKEEPTCLVGASSCVEVAPLARLFTDHAPQDEFILGLENPKVASFGVGTPEPACVKQETAVKLEPAWDERAEHGEGLQQRELLYTELVCVKQELADAAEWGAEGEGASRSGTAASQSETNTIGSEMKQESHAPCAPPAPARAPHGHPRAPRGRPRAPPAPPNYAFAFRCPHCGKGFRNQFVFTQHMFTHKSTSTRKTLSKFNDTTQKPLKCSHCKFKSRDALLWRTHQTLHEHDIRKGTKYKCRSCGFTCGRKTDLQKHTSALHERFKCSECCFNSKRISTLRRHQTNCHPT